jgi:hypothetical protein
MGGIAKKGTEVTQATVIKNGPKSDFGKNFDRLCLGTSLSQIYICAVMGSVRRPYLKNIGVRVLVMY